MASAVDDSATKDAVSSQPTKPSSRNTAVSKVYELLTNPPPRRLPANNNAAMKSSQNGLNNSSLKVTSTSVYSCNNSNRPTSPKTAHQETKQFDSDNFYTFRQQKQYLAIQNGHHFIQQFSSSSVKVPNAAAKSGSTSSNHSTSPTSSASSSSQHSPTDTKNLTVATSKRSYRPYSMVYTADDDDGEEYEVIRRPGGPMSSLLMINDGERPFDIHRAKFTKSATLASPKVTVTVTKETQPTADDDEDYPADFVKLTPRTRSPAMRHASWTASSSYTAPTTPTHSALHADEVSSGYSSGNHSPLPQRRRSSCLCSSLGIKCCSTRSPLQAASSMRDRPGSGPRAENTTVRSASSIKDMLLKWCQQVTAEYENVNITNFSSSWNDGIAFCAIVHHYFPNAFDFRRLDPKRRKANFKLAFDLAEKFGDVPQLLEVEDMVRMKQPDWKCVFTYVQTMYRKLHDKQPRMLPPRNQTASSSTASGTSSPPQSGPVEEEPNNPFKVEFEKMNLNG